MHSKCIFIFEENTEGENQLSFLVLPMYSHAMSIFITMNKLRAFRLLRTTQQVICKTWLYHVCEVSVFQLVCVVYIYVWVCVCVCVCACFVFFSFLRLAYFSTRDLEGHPNQARGPQVAREPRFGHGCSRLSPSFDHKYKYTL